MNTGEGFALLDTLPMGLFVLQTDATVLYWNRILERWTGIRRDAIVGRPIAEFFPEIDDPWVAGRIRDVFTLGAPAVF